ncbi:MAG: flagellar hook-basal body complex protein [Pirellulales bacterium]|nr:flagellar hook-basal body complex protein [Pirellulales bacterium]
MGLASSLSTALTGMTAAETTIDVVGNNLANSNTVGFKASDANFATQFLQTQSLGSSPVPSGSGGTNPRQTGLGTMVAEITPNFNQGTIEISTSPTDVAIQGEGFFIVQGNQGEKLYTRNGVFKLNSQNELVTMTGNRVLGFGVDDQFLIQSTQLVPIEIPLGQKQVAQATENVVLEGTLSPNGDLATTAEIIQTGVLGDGLYTQPPAGVAASQAATPPAGTTWTTGGGGPLTPLTTYQYRVVFADGAVGSITDTESLSSTTIGPITLAGAENAITLNNIPTDVNGDYSARRIYRSNDGGTTYHYVGEIPDNVTTSFADPTSDAVAAGNPTLNTDALTGAYTYYVTFADGAGGPGSGTESRPVLVSGQPNITGSRIQLQDLPVDASGQWNVRRIYRNLSTDENTFYYVGEINDATTAGLTYTDSASDATISLNAQINRNGPVIDENTLLTNLLLRDENDYNHVFDIPAGETGTLAFAPRKGGRLLTSKEFTITPTSTVANLLDFMEETMGIQMSPGPDPLNPIPPDGGSGSNPGGRITSSQIRFIGNNGVDNALEIGLSGMQLTTSAGTDNVILPFGSVQSAVGESAVADFLAYDSLGDPLAVRLTAVLESRDSTSMTYRWFANSGDNSPSSGADITVGTGLITFDGEGNFVSATNDQVTVERRGVPAESPLVFDLDFTQISGLATDESVLNVAYQDGSEPGNLTSFILGEDGKISGVFSNGATRDLGQIRLSRFANPNGLEQKGQNLFAEGVNSGLPTEGNPGAQGIGNIISGAVELSNTDIGGNLIDLILASTMYRGNTRVITTVQQMFDELLSLRR